MLGLVSFAAAVIVRVDKVVPNAHSHPNPPNMTEALLQEEVLMGTLGAEQRTLRDSKFLVSIVELHG